MLLEILADILADSEALGLWEADMLLEILAEGVSEGLKEILAEGLKEIEALPAASS